MPAVATKTRTFPVIEIFGPTIQGEGALAGLPTMFVRFGGC
jgi:7-carboxy-7-deazaguanine synthase